MLSVVHANLLSRDCGGIRALFKHQQEHMQLTLDFVLKVRDDVQQVNETDGASKICVYQFMSNMDRLLSGQYSFKFDINKPLTN